MKLLLFASICLCVIGGAALAAPQYYQFDPNQPAARHREHWMQLTQGTDLALGKKVLFYPTPNYRLTKDDNDHYDLTDGKLSSKSRMDDRIWFNKDAVGWAKYGRDLSLGILMRIDLGSAQPVGQIAIRVLGGNEQQALELPRSVQFMASVDGENYYTLQTMWHLTPAEKAKGTPGYDYAETGNAFMAPIVIDVPVKARYIALRVNAVGNFYADEISVLKATNGQTLRSLTSLPRAEIDLNGIDVKPRQTPFTVTTNIITPNWFVINDQTHLDAKKNKLGFVLQLPKGLKALPFPHTFRGRPPFKLLSSADGKNTYYCSYDGRNYHGTVGPVWIEKVGDVAKDAKVLLWGEVNGEKTHQHSYPLNFAKIPETHPLKGFDIALGWMLESVQMQWPNFLQDFRKMGFNDVPTFPRYFGKDENGKWNEGSQNKLAYLKEARAAGYGIIYNESPFHVMWKKVQSDLKAGKIGDEEADQLFTQVDGKRGKWMNILYHGKYVQGEVQRIANLAALVQPDQMYMDIEWFRHIIAENKKDPRVVAAWKKSGKSWDDFVTDIGQNLLAQIVSAVRQKVPHKLVVGLYYTDPKQPIFDQVFAWNKIYPKVVDIAMPEFYVQGQALYVAKRTRFDYDHMKVKEIIPWMSTGTYGEYPPKDTEAMVLETILNGARGITYFQYLDFDPMDYYYHAKAIKELAPYDQLLQDGKPVSYKGANPGLHYTAFSDGDEALVLVGNYAGEINGKVLLQSPLKSTSKVLLDGKSLKVNNGAVSIDVPAGECRLVYFKQ